MRILRSRFAAATAALAVVMTVTGAQAPGAASVGGPVPEAGSGARPGAVPRLTDPRPCPGQPGFTCSTLTVPLDHGGRAPGTLRLRVATADNVDAPKGTLLFLTGGPGQPGVPFISRLAGERLPAVARAYRFVMLDQRGSGESGAIDCPMLQAQVGSSDVETPTADAIRECAGVLGARRPFYGIDDNVADFEALRRALGVDRMTVDGVSYGTFTAARYALAHPHRVSRLVLDSVVPHVDPGRDLPLYLTGLRAAGRVLRDACRTAPRCGFDPAADLARVVARRGDGTTLFDRLVTYGFVDPTFRDAEALPTPGGGDIVGALHAAARGADAHLDELIAALRPGGDPVAAFSSGLHVATFCPDARFPWGDSAAPPAAREPALERRVRALRPAEVWPFDRATVKGIGLVRGCLHWPATAASGPEPPAGSKLPPVPTLLINGDRDLSTPMEWAFEEAARAPKGRVVIVDGAYHSIQNRERGTAGRAAVNAFLGVG